MMPSLLWCLAVIYAGMCFAAAIYLVPVIEWALVKLI